MSRPVRLGPTAARPLSHFSFGEVFCLWSSWMPPGQYGQADPPLWAACRWQTWAEYLDDFASVETAVRARFAHVPREPFAAMARAYRNRHSAAALARASYTAIRYPDREVP